MLVEQLSSLKKYAYHNIKDAPKKQYIFSTCPENSKILKYSLNFKILDCCDNFDIQTLESQYIHKLKPSLNDQYI